MATILSLVSWAVAIAVWIVLDTASPERERRFITSFFSSRFDVEPSVRDYWDMNLLPLAFGLLLAAIAICVGAFFFNKLRMRRKTDKYRKSIIIIGIITILGMVFFLIRFGGSLFGWGEIAENTLMELSKKSFSFLPLQL